MNTYSFRVKPLEGMEQATLAGLKKFLSKYCESWAVTREFGEKLGKLHFQGWAVSDLKRDYFNKNARNAMKGCIGAANAGMGINESDIRDFDALQRYVMKGVDKDNLPDVVTMQGVITCQERYVEKLHCDYWQQNTDMKQAIKDKKRKFYDVLQERCSELRNPGRSSICDVVLETYKEFEKSVDVYRIRAHVNQLWLKYDPDAKAAIKDAVMERI